MKVGAALLVRILGERRFPVQKVRNLGQQELMKAKCVQKIWEGLLVASVLDQHPLLE